MSSMRDIARQVFDACESGKGWEGCRQYCHPDATFRSQTQALAEIDTVEGYTEWMQEVYHLMPDASYEILSLGADEDTNSVAGSEYSAAPTPARAVRPRPASALKPTTSTS